MKALFLSLLCLLIYTCGAAQRISRDNLALMDSLDGLLNRVADFDAAKEASLAREKQRLASTADAEERFWIYRTLYQEYSSFDSDSALFYSSKALDLSRQLNREAWTADVLLRRAYIMAATGLLEEARNTLGDINVDHLSVRAFLDYCETALFLQTHVDQYTDERDPVLPYTASTWHLLETICSDLPVNDPDYYWLTGWQAMRSADSAAMMIPNIERVLSNSAYATHSDARNAWMLSSLYNKTADQERRLKYLILSAMADVRSSVREMASMEELARLAYEADDLDHANTYITYAMRCANLYHSRTRIMGLSALQHDISQAQAQRNLQQEKDLRSYFWILIAAVVLLSAALFVIFVQLHRLRSRERQLDKVNGELNSRVTELQDAREQLNAANQSLMALYTSVKEDAMELSRVNEAKEKYIADVFAICSEYINKLDEFRKRINRLIMAGRFDEVRQLTKSPELSHTELKELYANFDRIFLNIYPDFVADFNKLLRPDEQIELKKGEMLNTDLRIYALVRLGLNDSVKISRFLHCSVQTVYNTRLKIRNKAAVPREEFADHVRSLGKAVF